MRRLSVWPKAEVEILSGLPIPLRAGVQPMTRHGRAPTSLGEIMQVRQIYSTSAKVRRMLNDQAQAEPTTSPESVVP
jgi:hypothetical protein